MEKTKNIPKIRFKGYKDEWEKDIIENVGDFYSGGTPASNNESYYNGDIPFIRSGEIKNVTTELCISKKGLESSSAKLVKKGDVLLALYGATSGEVSISKINGAINQAILAIIPNKNFNNYFIKNYFVVFKNEINNRFLQGGQKNLSGNLVKSIIFNRPKIEEQKQIGSLFKNLDEKLEIEREKHEKLVNFKKAMLENVFPKEGEKRPKIRFGGYNHDWKEGSLGEFNTKYSDGNYGESYPKRSDFRQHNCGVPFYRGTNLQNGKIVKKDCLFISEEKHSELLSGHLILDDIVIAVRGSIGALGYVSKEFVDHNINSQLAIIRTNKNYILGKYLVYYLLSNNGYQEIQKLVTGSALKQLPIKNLDNISITTPSINEQKLIGSFFKNLDEKIQVSEEKITKIENFKKAMMEAMFV